MHSPQKYKFSEKGVLVGIIMALLTGELLEDLGYNFLHKGHIVCYFS